MDSAKIQAHIVTQNDLMAKEFGDGHLYDRNDTSNSYTPFYEIIGGVSDEDILLAEKTLHVRFCEDYKKFLSVFGCITTKTDTTFLGPLSALPQLTHDEAMDFFLNANKDFFENRYEGPELINATLFMTTEGDEWFGVIEHSKGTAVPYDPFSKKLVREMQVSLEDFILQQL